MNSRLNEKAKDLLEHAIKTAGFPNVAHIIKA